MSEEGEPERERTLPPPEEAPWAQRDEEPAEAPPPEPAPPLGERVRRLGRRDALARLAGRSVLPPLVLLVLLGLGGVEFVATALPFVLFLLVLGAFELDQEPRRLGCGQLYFRALALGCAVAVVCLFQLSALHDLLERGDTRGGLKTLSQVLDQGWHGLRAVLSAGLTLAAPLACSVTLRAAHHPISRRLGFVALAGTLVGVVLGLLFPGIVVTPGYQESFDLARSLQRGASFAIGATTAGVVLALWSGLWDWGVARLIKAPQSPAA